MVAAGLSPHACHVSFRAEEAPIPFFSLLSLASGAMFLRYAFLVHLW
jgi:hypothetical protein